VSEGRRVSGVIWGERSRAASEAADGLEGKKVRPTHRPAPGSVSQSILQWWEVALALLRRHWLQKRRDDRGSGWIGRMDGIRRHRRGQGGQRGVVRSERIDGGVEGGGRACEGGAAFAAPCCHASLIWLLMQRKTLPFSAADAAFFIPGCVPHC